MRNLTILLSLFIVFSCSKDETTPEQNPNQQNPNQIVSLEIIASSNILVANGNDNVTFIVNARNLNQDIIQNSNYTIYVNGNIYNSNTFSTEIAGQYTVYAKINSVQSNSITITAEEVQVVLSSISLNTNTALIIADGNSSAELSIVFYDENNNQINNVNYEIIDNGNSLNSSSLLYSTTVNGSHDLKIQADGVESNTININARENLDYNQISVPVIFHIVHFGESIGSGTNLTQTQVTSLLNMLNNGFSNQYNSTNPNATDTKISFRLATLDSNNNQLSESGINRVNATSYDDGVLPTSYDIANDSKLGYNEYLNLAYDTYWDPEFYLNLWIGPEQDGVGSASYAATYESYPLDGLITVPDNYDAAPNDNIFPGFYLDTNYALTSNVVIHEVGHSFGLLHVFSTDNCASSDFCKDSYSYNLETFQACSDNLGFPDYDNFMDYTGSYTTFTYDQRERIQHVFEHGLWFNELKYSNQ